MATIDDVIRARHNSNFNDVLLEYLVSLDTEIVDIHRHLAGLNKHDDDDYLIARYGEPQTPEVSETASTPESATETSTPNT